MRLVRLWLSCIFFNVINLSCSWGHPPGFPALPSYAWHHSYHPHCACSSDGWRQCECEVWTFQEIKSVLYIIYAALLCFYGLHLIWYFLQYLIGWESKGNSNSALCCWFEHTLPNLIRNSSACCDWRVLHVCCAYHLDHFGWSLQWYRWSSWGCNQRLLLFY